MGRLKQAAPWRREERPEIAAALPAMRERIRGLLHGHILHTASVEALLISAYKQGVEDAVEIYMDSEEE